MTAHVHRFRFFPPEGTTFDEDLGDIGCTMRRSRLGTMVLIFPAPYEDLEIVDGERMGLRKFDRVREAIERLRQRKAAS